MVPGDRYGDLRVDWRILELKGLSLFIIRWDLEPRMTNLFKLQPMVLVTVPGDAVFSELLVSV